MVRKSIVTHDRSDCWVIVGDSGWFIYWEQVHARANVSYV